MARANPHRFSHLTVSRDGFSALEGSLDPNAFENVHYGNSDVEVGQSFGQVRPQTTAWECCEPMDTRFLDQYMPDMPILHQSMQGALPNVVWPPEQHQGHEQAGRTMSGPSFHHLGTFPAIQQSQTVHDATGGSHATLMNMYSVPDGGSHDVDTGVTRLDQDVSSVQLQKVKATPVKSLVCPICKRKSKNRPALRYVSRTSCQRIEKLTYPPDITLTSMIQLRPASTNATTETATTEVASMPPGTQRTYADTNSSTTNRISPNMSAMSQTAMASSIATTTCCVTFD